MAKSCHSTTNNTGRQCVWVWENNMFLLLISWKYLSKGLLHCAQRSSHLHKHKWLKSLHIPTFVFFEFMLENAGLLASIINELYTCSLYSLPPPKLLGHINQQQQNSSSSIKMGMQACSMLNMCMRMSMHWSA